jgi:Nucleotide modification associated domain 3
MRIVLSRKGFDSGSGGCPSPIFPDGSMLALPIPDRRSTVRYCDIAWNGRNVGEIVERLTRGKHKASHGAHLDPDLRQEARPRVEAWRPMLGQVAAAQGHLRNRGVGVADLFLFWGLFREVDAALRWRGPPRHILWGWLHVGAVVNVAQSIGSAAVKREWRWAAEHPHVAAPRGPTNTLYVASDRLVLGGLTGAAAGVFEHHHSTLELTAPGAEATSVWSLPALFEPQGRPALSYHDAPDRWSRDGSRVFLRAASRGQEFVLDAANYPGAVEWAATVIAAKSRAG